jgi:hypothetical protein
VSTGPQLVWAAPPPRRRRGRIVLLTVIAVVVALLAAAIVAFTLLRQQAETRAAAAVSVVTAYLQAVASGDAARALAQVDQAPDVGGFLTDDALAASSALGTIDDITVTAAGIVGANGQVRAHYTVGGTAVDGTFDVVDFDGDGSYKLATVSRLEVGDRFRGLDVTLNGLPLPSGVVDVFPGAYQLATAQPFFTLGETNTFTIADSYSQAMTVRPALSDAGLAAYRAAVAAAVNACIGSHALASGCGLDLAGTLADGTTVYDGTVFRTLSPAAQAALPTVVPTLDPSNPTVATSGDIGAVTTSADCTQAAVDGQCDIVDAPGLHGAAVIMTESPLAVQWH